MIPTRNVIIRCVAGGVFFAASAVGGAQQILRPLNADDSTAILDEVVHVALKSIMHIQERRHPSSQIDLSLDTSIINAKHQLAARRFVQDSVVPKKYGSNVQHKMIDILGITQRQDPRGQQFAIVDVRIRSANGERCSAERYRTQLLLINGKWKTNLIVDAEEPDCPQQGEP